MLNGEKYSFASQFDRFGEVSYAPYLPIRLSYRSQSIQVMGLLDTGASMNVLPYEIGLQLVPSRSHQMIPVGAGSPKSLTPTNKLEKPAPTPPKN